MRMLTACCALQGVSLADFVSEKRSFQVEELCSTTMKLPMMEGLDRTRKRNAAALDLSPAKDPSLSDIAAVKAVVAASSLSLEAANPVTALVHFAVLLRVRALRQCQSAAFRQHVLRMRMKGMYALFSSQKNSSASALRPHPHPHPVVVCSFFGVVFCFCLLLVLPRATSSAPHAPGCVRRWCPVVPA